MFKSLHNCFIVVVLLLLLLLLLLLRLCRDLQAEQNEKMNKFSRPKIADQFADLKRELSTVC